ncbi:2-amino-4-hydroxy-6-hydroxymethyldihydropteridinepyrophosphokinase [Pseudoruegeria aquimaris]|uniref:2-amino-4-hydroxy-6-hydroxymethyldihydropteridine pyrophosphokinase n=1 Tax=Pseudoruegeria aquimaris TaxID=393663 RepID=A0A1Y5S1N7_9RHOB|nr:2-amino-4-hydroxy-6-hydroxymethyldihydropteridine diphosphokinase [Pseudoruegeria aquimaris]SLN29181.1 2-amino-4-hydroxy-6-hydroxymethyldihydropteridinepyrophosphokinase [Pseudoruegeria aquimaris]
MVPQPSSSHKTETIALIALGGNVTSSIGTPLQTLQSAIRELAAEVGTIRRRSRFFRTPCFPAGAGPDYVNAAIALETRLAPRPLLDALHRIEAAFGRERVERWGQRTLDLDLLAYGDLVLPDLATQDRWRNLPEQEQRLRAPDDLVLPHPRLQERAFVLIPLAEVAPEWRHPVLGLTVAQMRESLSAEACEGVEPLAESRRAGA